MAGHAVVRTRSIPPFRRLAVAIATLALVVSHADIVGAQTGIGGSNIYGPLKRELTRPVPSAPSPPAPGMQVPGGSIWVPDRYVPVPGVDGLVHVPGHWEREASSHDVFVPPLVGTAPDGSRVFFPGEVRPKAEQRQAP